jgi:hypothetical protein
VRRRCFAASARSAQHPEHSDAPAAFDSEAPSRIETETYALELRAASSASLDAPVPVALTIEGRGDFHVNLEYPLRVELGASPNVALAVRTFSAKDALELSEERAHFETEARFDGDGKHWLAARVQFAVCTEETCVPREEALALALDAH